MKSLQTLLYRDMKYREVAKALAPERMVTLLCHKIKLKNYDSGYTGDLKKSEAKALLEWSILDRINRPEKNWKFSISDAQERIY